MTDFRRGPGGITVSLGEHEVELLRQIVAEMVEVVSADGPEPGDIADAVSDGQEWARELGLVDDAAVPPQPPSDPVTARLFPDAYRDDPDASGDFRRFTEGDLRAVKAAHATSLLGSLPEGGGVAVLDAETAAAWLGALNDARLALGTALGIEQDQEFDFERWNPDSLRGQRLLIYDWLNAVQSGLLDALMDDGTD